MSLSSPFHAFRQAARSFASSSRHAVEGFSAVQSILSRPSSSFLPAQSTSSSFLRPSSVPNPAVVPRGYAPEALPPKSDPVLELLTNLLMKHGRKAEAQARVARILQLIQRASNSPPVPLLQRAISLASPSVRLMSLRMRNKRTETPRALDERQRTRQGIMWIFRAAEKGRKGGTPREVRIAREVLSVLEGEAGGSEVYKWLEERHKLATAARSTLPTRR